MTENWWGQTYIKSCEDMSEIPDASVHCCVTSPPYFGLRDYGTGTWVGGSDTCNHALRKPSTVAKQVASSSLHGGKSTVGFQKQSWLGGLCGCGAQRIDEQIGLEATLTQYIERLVGVFREVRRVLRQDGTAWIIIGDSYCSSDKWGGGGENTGKHRVTDDGSVPSWASRTKTSSPQDGIKSKDLMGVPWTLAFALRADGWWVRDAIIWHKTNPMPSSVTDRCTMAYEFIFMLAKSSEYYADMESVKYRIQDKAHYRFGNKAAYNRTTGNMRLDAPDDASYAEANLRNVWALNTQPYPAAHFAVFPPEIAMRCIRIGCPEGGVVLDPFMGSGTTAQVAEALNRRWVGYELNPAYQQLIQDRLAQPLTFGTTASKRLSQFCIYCGQRVIGPYSAHVSCEAAS